MPQLKLHQVIALEKGIKPRAMGEFTKAHNMLQNANLLTGFSRKYTAKNDEDNERLPAESMHVQIRAAQMLDHVQIALVRMFDVVLTRETGNCSAKADILVDGQVLATNVPATYLLFLEKQLSELTAFVSRLPVHDPSEIWTHDRAMDVWRTNPVETVRTKKVPRNHVLAESTQYHPAQVNMYHEDVPVGIWTTVKFSGALPQERVTEIKQRLVKLAEAVKLAREAANSIAVEDKKIGAALFGYLFA